MIYKYFCKCIYYRKFKIKLKFSVNNKLSLIFEYRMFILFSSTLNCIKVGFTKTLTNSMLSKFL